MKLFILPTLVLALVAATCTTVRAASPVPSQCVPLSSCADPFIDAELALHAAKARVARETERGAAELEARARYIKRLRWIDIMEHEQSRIEGDKAGEYPEGTFDAKAHAARTAAQLALVQKLTPVIAPNAEQQARAARVRELNANLADLQSRAAAEYKAATERGLGAAERTELLNSMKASYKPVADELLALQSAAKQDELNGPAASTELTEAREQLLRLVRIGELPDRAKLLESARRQLAQDETTLATFVAVEAPESTLRPVPQRPQP